MVSGRWTIVVAGLITVLLGAWGALSWSLIPVAIDGRVRGTSYQADTGRRWGVIGLTSRRDMAVDGTVIADLGGRRLNGERIEKRRFSPIVTVGSKRTRLEVSARSWEVIAVLAMLAVVAAGPVVTRRNRRSVDSSFRRASSDP